jgi:hypothetical protein
MAGHFSAYVFHDNSQPIGDFQKAWATACCTAGIVKRVCPASEADVRVENKCLACANEWKSEDLKYTGALFHDFRRTAARNLVRAGGPFHRTWQPQPSGKSLSRPQEENENAHNSRIIKGLPKTDRP